MLAEGGDHGPDHEHNPGEVDPEDEGDDERKGVSESSEAFTRIPIELPNVGRVVGEDLLRDLPENAGDEGTTDRTSLPGVGLRDEIIELKKHRRRDEERHEQAQRANRLLPTLTDPRLVETGKGQHVRPVDRLDEYRHPDRHDKEEPDLKHHPYVEQVAPEQGPALVPVLLECVANCHAQGDEERYGRQKQTDATDPDDGSTRTLQLMEKIDDLVALAGRQEVVDEPCYGGEGIAAAEHPADQPRRENDDGNDRHEHFERDRLCPEKQVLRRNLRIQSLRIVVRVGP